MRALHPKMSMNSTKSRLHASVMQKKVPRCVQANENRVEIFLFIMLYYNTMTWTCQRQENGSFYWQNQKHIMASFVAIFF